MAAPKALVLQHAAAEGPGRIGAALAARGLNFRVARIDRGDAVPDDLGGARALVVMGGPQSARTPNEPAHLAQEIALIERALDEHVPILGVCLGAQLLAAALGAEVRRGPEPEIGWHAVTLTDAAAKDPLFGKLPSRFDALHWHGDTFDLPHGAKLLARSTLTEHQAFREGDRAWGIQFHLETDAAQTEEMTKAFPDDLAAAGIDAAKLVADVRAAMKATDVLAAKLFAAFADLAAR